MKEIRIDSSHFSSLDGFYDELEKYLVHTECPWGRNLDSLNELIYYQFNYTDNRENNVTTICWIGFSKSQKEILDVRGDRKVIDVLEELFSSNKDISFVKK